MRLSFATQQIVRNKEFNQERHEEGLRWMTLIDEARPSDGGIAHPNGFEKVLAECHDVFVLDFLATRAYAPASSLAYLALHADPLLREVVAGNPRTSPKTLEELAGDSYGGVCLVVAANPRTHPSEH